MKKNPTLARLLLGVLGFGLAMGVTFLAMPEGSMWMRLFMATVAAWICTDLVPRKPREPSR